MWLLRLCLPQPHSAGAVLPPCQGRDLDTEQQTTASDIARQRHEARLQRLERIKQERAERMAKKKQALSGEDGSEDSKKAAIQAALDRVKRKKEQARHHRKTSTT